jgi:hypothetical protein
LERRIAQTADLAGVVLEKLSEAEFADRVPAWEKSHRAMVGPMHHVIADRAIILIGNGDGVGDRALAFLAALEVPELLLPLPLRDDRGLRARHRSYAVKFTK